MSRSIHTLLDELWLYSRAAYCRQNGTHTTYIHMDVQIKFTLEIISYHMRSWWMMADDNWSAKTYSIQFQAKETSNQSNCVVSTLSNDDLTLTKWSFSATIHLSRSLARSLPLTHSPHLTSPQFNATSTQLNSTNHSIRLFTYSLTYWFRSSLINTYILSFTLIISHIRFLTWLLTHFITHPLTYSSTHSLAQKFTRSLNYSHIHVITQSFTHSPTRSSIHALSISSYIHPITNL